MNAADHVYRYAAPSRREGALLALRTSGGGAVERAFLDGRVLQPRATGDWLLAVAALTRQRFFTPSATREPRIVLADPVVTVAREQVRFEGLSSCCGVYSRLDCGGDAIAAERRSVGTTSVDVGETMCTALLALRDGEHVRVQIGTEGAPLARAGDPAIERRVELPSRWRRAFAEVHAVMSGMERCAEMGGKALLTLLRALPRTGASGWFVPNGRTMRLSPTATASGIRIGGAERLALLEPLLPHAVDVLLFGRYGVAEAPFGVVLRRPGMELTVVVTPASWRGFAGDGAVLRDLVQPLATAVAEQLEGALAEHDVVRTDGSEEQRRALARLALEGRVGFDLETNAWFRRELPFDRSSLADLPRLAAAQEVLASGRVVVRRDEAQVDTGEGRHRLSRTADGEWSCTCAFAQQRFAQGPCVHALAVMLGDS